MAATKTRYEMFCRICGIKFEGVYNSVYCSVDCKRKAEARVKKDQHIPKQKFCRICGNAFEASSNSQNTCSDECRCEARKMMYRKYYAKVLTDKDKSGARKLKEHDRYVENCASISMRRIAKNVEKKRNNAILLQPKEVEKNFNGNIRQGYESALGITRLSGKGCKCLRCGKEFELICNKSAAKTYLDRRLANGQSPCPYCGQRPTGVKGASNPEMEIQRKFPSFTEIHFRPDWLDGRELDLFDPVNNVAIEYNGLRFHSTALKSSRECKREAREKTALCEEHGIQLLTVLESDWVQHREIVVDRISAILHTGLTRFYARKLTVCSPDDDPKEFIDFMKANHIQGNTTATWKVGLRNGDGELLAVCTFKYGTGYASGGLVEGSARYWELNRYATKLGTTVVGGLSRCISEFRKAHPDVGSIISFADRRWTSNIRSAYSSTGFVPVDTIEQNYMYTDLKPDHELKNKQFMRKSSIQKRAQVPGSPESAVWSANKTEFQMARELGYYQVFDAGKIKYELKFA